MIPDDPRGPQEDPNMISDEMIPDDLSPDDLRWFQMIPDEIFGDSRRSQMIPDEPR